MARKLLAGGLVAVAVLAGAATVSAALWSADHTTSVPAANQAAVANAAPNGSSEAVDLRGWQETAVTIVGSRTLPPRRR
ncbi:MAG: hypothetical protein MUF18_02665 [Fimbriiglobus sp.]|jgi:hypothetical protein|nr:hypothetical protein [Fimbriiglobus sp.]